MQPATAARTRMDRAALHHVVYLDDLGAFKAWVRQEIQRDDAHPLDQGRRHVKRFKTFPGQLRRGIKAAIVGMVSA